MFKAYTEFQKLKRVMIGRGISPSIVENDSLRHKLTPTTKRLLIQLLDETEEDYQNLIKICEQFGVEVLRPEYSLTDTFDPYLMNPRDDLIVLDKTLVCTQEAERTTVDYIYPVIDERKQVKRKQVQTENR